MFYPLQKRDVTFKNKFRGRTLRINLINFFIVNSPLEMVNTGTELIESAHKVLLTSQRKIQNTGINRADLRCLRQQLNEGINVQKSFPTHQTD